MPTPNDDKPLVVREQADGSVTVDDPALTVPAEGGESGGTPTEGTDTPPTTGDDAPSGDDEHGDAEALAGATNDAEREAIRARRRQERKDRKEAQKQREEWLRNELAARDRLIQEMNQRLQGVENRATQADVAQLDASIKRAAGAVEYYKNIVAEATKKQDGAAVADATEKMVLAREEANRLANIKQQFSRQAANPQTPAMAPQVLEHATAWMKENSWYKPQGGDMDSEIVLSVDRQLEREGFNAASASYWDELSKRVAKLLPHRAGKGYTPPNSHGEPGTTGRSPVAGGGRSTPGTGNGSGKASGSYTLSAERVRALKDAGVWDDPKARSDAIRRYRDYDRAKAAEQRS